MKAVLFDEFGPPHEVGYCGDVADPGEPGADEVVVEVDAFPINPADLLTITGMYAMKPPLPYTPGAEGTGRIAAMGAEVEGFEIGDRVILLCRENWTQMRKVQAADVLKVPEGDVAQLAMLKVNPATAFLMLKNYVDLRPGDWVIQDAANSGVGASVIRLAKTIGAKTVNVVRRAELEAPLMAQGAVVVDGEGLADKVAAVTDGGKVRLAIDAVAGDTCYRVAECLSENGVMVNYGMLSGEPCKIRPDWIVFKSVTLKGFWLAKELGAMNRAAAEALYAELGGLINDGSLAVNVEAVYGNDDIKDALAHAGREGRAGKVLVSPNGSI